MKFELLYRPITALIFLAAFFAQTFSKSFVIADYITNTIKYAKNCVNTAKPKMQCKGKCQMIKKIQQEEKKDQDNPSRKSENKNEITLSLKSSFSSFQDKNFQFVKKHYPILQSPKEKDRSSEVFHPPC